MEIQEPNSAGLQNLVKPLGEAIQKAHALTEGKRTDAFNHQKVIAESLSTLSWVVYTGKDCGKGIPRIKIFYALNGERTMSQYTEKSKSVPQVFCGLVAGLIVKYFIFLIS